MNYIKELNAFKDWQLFNQLPPSAVLLWHTLMMIKNTARRVESFNAPHATVENLSGLTKKRILEARQILAEHQLISFELGVKGKAPVYQMKSLVTYFEQLSPSSSDQLEEQLQEQLEDQLADQSQDQVADQSAGAFQVPFRNNQRDILKEKDIEKEKEKRRVATQNAYTVYEQNFGILKPIVQESFLAWCSDLGDELVIEGIKLAAQKGGRTFSFIESILKEWAQAGVTSVEQARTYEQQRKRNQSSRFLVQRNSKNKSVLEEFRRDVQA